MYFFVYIRRPNTVTSKRRVETILTFSDWSMVGPMYNCGNVC